MHCNVYSFLLFAADIYRCTMKRTREGKDAEQAKTIIKNVFDTAKNTAAYYEKSVEKLKKLFDEADENTRKDLLSVVHSYFDDVPYGFKYDDFLVSIGEADADATADAEEEDESQWIDEPDSATGISEIKLVLGELKSIWKSSMETMVSHSDHSTRALLELISHIKGQNVGSDAGVRCVVGEDYEEHVMPKTPELKFVNGPGISETQVGFDLDHGFDSGKDVVGETMTVGELVQCGEGEKPCA